MARKKRTDKELIDASYALAYEVWMFKELANKLAVALVMDTPKHDPVAYNALLEAFLVHTRNLLDFLYSYKPHPDDIIAEDFFATSDDWTTKRPKKSSFLADLKTPINRTISHLSYKRLGVPKRQWQPDDVEKEIDTAIDCFLSLIPDRLISDRWDKLGLRGEKGQLTGCG